MQGIHWVLKKATRSYVTEKWLRWTFFLKRWKIKNGVLGFPGMRKGINRENRSQDGFSSHRRQPWANTPALRKSLPKEINSYPKCASSEGIGLVGCVWMNNNTSPLFCLNILLDGSRLSKKGPMKMTRSAPGKLVQFSVNSIIKEEVGHSLPQIDLSTRNSV